MKSNPMPFSKIQHSNVNKETNVFYNQHNAATIGLSFEILMKTFVQVDTEKEKIISSFIKIFGCFEKFRLIKFLMQVRQKITS